MNVRVGGVPAEKTSLPWISSAVLTVTLGLAAACWVVAVRQMNWMDMGAVTRLGSFASLIALWVVMMAAMMLSGAAPAVLSRAHASGRMRAVPLFAGSYLAVWALAGVCVYATRPASGGAAMTSTTASETARSAMAAGLADCPAGPCAPADRLAPTRLGGCSEPLTCAAPRRPASAGRP